MSRCRVFQRNQPGEKPEIVTSVQCLEDSEKASMAGARARTAVKERGSQTSGPGRPWQELGFCSVCGWGATRGFEQGSGVCLNGTRLVAVYRKDCRDQDGNRGKVGSSYAGRCPGRGWRGFDWGWGRGDTESPQGVRVYFGGRACRTAVELTRGGVKSGRVGEGGAP